MCIKKTVVACVLIRTETETAADDSDLGTITHALRALSAWLTAPQEVTHVAMELTGSYGKPIFNILQDAFTTWLVNPARLAALADDRLRATPDELAQALDELKVESPGHRSI